MTQKQLKGILESVAALHPTHQIMLLAKCEGSIVHRKSPIWGMGDYKEALRFMRNAPDCELHYMVGEQQGSGASSYRPIETKALITRKTQAKIDAVYAKNSSNLKYADEVYIPTPSDFLDVVGVGPVPMGDLVPYALKHRLHPKRSKVLQQKIFRHTITGVMYNLTVIYHVRNLWARLSSGENDIKGSPTWLYASTEPSHEEELGNQGYTIKPELYRAARRKHGISDFLSAL